MHKIKKTFLLIAAGVSIGLSLFTTEKTQASNTNDTGTETEPAPFLEGHPSTILCASTKWTQTKYFSTGGSLLGTYLIQAGIVKSTYGGTYSSSETTSGGAEAHNADINQCYNPSWSIWCQPITAKDACE